MKSMAIQNRIQLREFIRYQLSQLSAKNAHHEFERLAFELAKIRIASNLLPATGPVQSGGDQGRDFESYQTYLSKTTIASSTFLTRISDGIIVGACSLEKKIEQKIKKDLQNIFKQGTIPTRIVYFCETDLPVAKRHKLQEHCSGTYQASLEIFDGQAISDMLAEKDSSWIAEEFLSTPSMEWDDIPTDGRYALLKEKWLVKSEKPYSYSDFLEIKEGLRKATHNDTANVDLDRWLKIMSAILDVVQEGRLAQKVRYEVIVAELRGNGSLDPAQSFLSDFFQNLENAHSTLELFDAAILNIYAAGAVSRQATSISISTLTEYKSKTYKIINDLLRDSSSRNDICMLSQSLAMLTITERDNYSNENEWMDDIYKKWQSVIDIVIEIPLYPINQISNVLELFQTEIFEGENDEFRQLIEKVDILISTRIGSKSIAEKYHQRAVDFLNHEKYVLAIDELQKAKVAWFTGETIFSSIKAMLLISNAYEKLHLYYAARYYAAGAIFFALNHVDEEVKLLIPEAFFRWSVTFIAAGEVIYFFHSIKMLLESHFSIAEDAFDLTKYPGVQALLQIAFALRILISEQKKELLPFLDKALSQWPLADEDKLILEKISQKEPELINELMQDVFGRKNTALNNVISQGNTINWSALGIIWTISSSLDKDSCFAMTEIATLLQLLQVEFSRVDLVIIPSKVFIKIEIKNIEAFEIKLEPNNNHTSWNIELPKQYSPDGSDSDRISIAIAITILRSVTALPEDEFLEIIEIAFKKGITDRLHSVQPVKSLLHYFFPDEFDLNELLSIDNGNGVIEDCLEPVEAFDLRWKDTPGPGYSKDKAEEYLQKRYDIASSSIKVTLPRLLKDYRCRNKIEKLRQKGLPDWQILLLLSNIVCQWQIENKNSSKLSPFQLAALLKERIDREENDSDIRFSHEHLTDEIIESYRKVLIGSAFNVWDLHFYNETPDFSAMKKLLDVRYFHSTDDIPHEDPFKVN
jgi:hypothetical protein